MKTLGEGEGVVVTKAPGMRVEVYDQPNGLGDGPEVWVKVLSNSVVDWPDVERRLTPEQVEILQPRSRRPVNFYPHLVTAEEKAEHGMAYEDWFVFTAPVRAVVRAAL